MVLMVPLPQSDERVADLLTVRVDHATDRVLLLGAGRGDRASLEAIFRRYHSLVRAIVCRSLGVTDASDTVQEVFLRLFRSLSQIRDPDALKSFLTGIAIRVVRSELRSRRVRSIVTLSEDAEADARRDESSDSKELVVALYRELGKLDDEVRLAFVLRHVQGMTLPEVAEHLECSLATAKRRLSVASEALGDHFGTAVQSD